MPISTDELARVVADLSALVGRKVTGVWQPEPDRLLLQLGDTLILAVVNGPFARLHVSLGRPQNPRRPYSFQGILRRRLSEPLQSIAQRDSDRVVELIFGRYILHFRLFERGGGAYLLEDGVVLAGSRGPAPPQLPPLAPRPAPASTWAEGRSGAEIRAYWDAREASDQATALAAAREQALRTHIAREFRLIANLQADLVASAEAPKLRAAADTLAAHLHALSRARGALTLPDIADPKVLHRYSLDSGASYAAHLTRLYRRAGALERGAAHAERRLSDARARLAQLNAGIIPRSATAAAPDSERSKGVSAGIDRWVGPEGALIWVGRNAKANRVLTFQLAKSRDWWMHLRDQPGAHLVLRRADGGPPPLSHLLAAAWLATRQNRLSPGDSVDLLYARVRDIRPVAGGPDGAVVVSAERVFHYRVPEFPPEGWERLAKAARAPI